MIHPSTTATKKTEVQQHSARNLGGMNKSLRTMMQRKHHQLDFPPLFILSLTDISVCFLLPFVHCVE